jgi:hypothetical protein
MDLGNNRTVLLLILLCVSVALLGAASSYLFLGSNGPDTSVGTEELHIPSALITDDMSPVFESLEASYPDNVIIGNDEVVLSGFEVIEEFDSVYFTNELEFNCDSMEDQEMHITYIVNGDDIRYSQDISDLYRPSAADEEVHISCGLINDDINDTLNMINETYPGSVTINEDDVILLGSEAHAAFNTFYFENGLELECDSNISEEQKVHFMIKDDDYILQSVDITDLYNDRSYDQFVGGNMTDLMAANAHNNIIITYEELEGMLNGDNDTVQHFREMLDMYEEIQNNS